MTIDLLICGGTIDKTYFPEREVFDFEKTHVQEMINQARIPNANINVKFLFQKDSLDMNNQDRQRILRACNESLSHKILIMHGTSTMIESAKLVANNSLGGKNIVFFGAMLPYELAKSDALFNFGFALAACQLSEPGVHIAMNGIVRPHDNISKDEERAMFVPHS